MGISRAAAPALSPVPTKLRHFADRVDAVYRRFGPAAAATMVARRASAFGVRLGASVICTWHRGLPIAHLAAREPIETIEATRNDLPRIAALMRENGWPHASAAASARLHAGHRCFLALASGVPVSYVWASLEPHNLEELWDMRLEPGQARSYDAFTTPAHRGRGLLPALQSRLLETLAAEGISHLFTSIGGDNLSSVRAFSKVQPIKRVYPYFMARGMERPLVPGMSLSTLPRLEAVPRPFDGVNATNVVG